MEKGVPKKNVLFCLAFLAGLNLAIVLVAAQLPYPMLGFEALAQRVNLQTNLIPASASNQSFQFPSCTGGDSVNCHTKGNRAGL